MFKTLHRVIFLFIFSSFLISWGSVGHRTINYKCPESFPVSMNAFKIWADSLQMNGSVADNRKSSDPNESPKHYIDIDNYSEFISMGRIASTYDSVVVRHGSSFVISNGTLPWATLNTYDSLVVAFQKRKWHKAMLLASDLGHYVADGHMPLHITANYDGGLTNQSGIHSRYESNMVGTYSSSLSNYAGSTVNQITNKNKYVLNYIYSNYPYVDSVLKADTYAKNLARNNTSTQYYTALWSKTRFTTTLFKNASHSLAELIYTAWVEAGSPAFGSTVISSIPTALAENNISFYPNPTNGIIKLIGDDILKAEIKNISGISLGLFYDNHIDISSLPNGIYFINIYGKKGLLKKEKVLLNK